MRLNDKTEHNCRKHGCRKYTDTDMLVLESYYLFCVKAYFPRNWQLYKYVIFMGLEKMHLIQKDYKRSKC